MNGNQQNNYDFDINDYTEEQLEELYASYEYAMYADNAVGFVDEI